MPPFFPARFFSAALVGKAALLIFYLFLCSAFVQVKTDYAEKSFNQQKPFFFIGLCYKIIMDNFGSSSADKEKEFLEAYQLYADKIYRHCYFKVYNKDLAEDLTQETFIKTWKYITEGKEVKNIQSFLYRVAVNLIIDHSRKKTAVVFDEIKEKEASLRLYSMERSMLDALEGKEIIEVVQRLEKKYSQVIIMRYIDGLSPGEIADILQISTNAVSVKINYAMKKLREIVKIKYHE